MKEEMSLAYEYIVQCNKILVGCIKAQEKKIEDLRKIQYISIQITQSIDFLSHLRTLHRDIKSMQKQIQKELVSLDK